VLAATAISIFWVFIGFLPIIWPFRIFQPTRGRSASPEERF
jgi:hypothetical protein